jgi:ubiquinone biosynthesis accessory factor UbiK
MMNFNLIEDFAKRASALLPADLKAAQADFESNIKALLQSKMSEWNFVSRSDFEAQQALLKRLHERLDALEKSQS